MKRFEFQFPTTVFSSTVPDDVVFCGKVITRRNEPVPAPQRERETRVLLRAESSGQTNRFVGLLRSASGRYIGNRRSESHRKRYNGMFGTVKFPLQMELSDIKTRRERREALPPAPTVYMAKDHGGESYWELVRPLRHQGMLKKALFVCLPIV